MRMPAGRSHIRQRGGGGGAGAGGRSLGLTWPRCPGEMTIHLNHYTSFVHPIPRSSEMRCWRGGSSSPLQPSSMRRELRF